MIKAIIIDDEPLARSIVQEYLRGYPEIQVLQECNDGFEGVKAIAQHKPDVIFLDIQMPKINGFEMLELVEQPPAVIFTTAFDEYAIKAFEAHAIDYLLKPFSKERFDKALQKWLQQRQHQPSANQPSLPEEIRQPEERTRIVVKEGSNIRIIPVHEVLYLEARYSLMTVDSMMTLPLSTNVGTTALGLSFRYSVFCCSPARRFK
jgi:two-component system LytT family response regulator